MLLQMKTLNASTRWRLSSASATYSMGGLLTQPPHEPYAHTKPGFPTSLPYSSIWESSLVTTALFLPLALATSVSRYLQMANGWTLFCKMSSTCQIYIAICSLSCTLCAHNNLYIIKLQVISPVTANIAMFDSHIIDIIQLPDHALTMCLTSSATSLDLWHHHLGHLHTNTVTCMADNSLVTGMTISDREALSSPCEQVLSHVHTNVCGPLPTPSHCGHKYFLTFINDFSCFAFESIPLVGKVRCPNKGLTLCITQQVCRDHGCMLAWLRGVLE